MSRAGHAEFRSGDILATVFTGTLGERHGDPVERIPTPQRLLDWLATNGLGVDDCSDAQLHRARDLREAIHAAATAAATGAPLPAAAVGTINDAARHGRAYPRLGPDGERRWCLDSGTGTGTGGGGRGGGRVEDALSVIAADAITVLATTDPARLALCASPTCRAVFVDGSQSHTRRWCDMNTCGNRQKKARHRKPQGPGSASITSSNP